MLSALQKLNPSWQDVGHRQRQPNQRNADARQRPVAAATVNRFPLGDEQDAEDREEQAYGQLYYYDDELQNFPSRPTVILYEDHQQAAVNAMLDFGRVILICAAVFAISLAGMGFAVHLNQIEQQLVADARV